MQGHHLASLHIEAHPVHGPHLLARAAVVLDHVLRTRACSCWRPSPERARPILTRLRGACASAAQARGPARARGQAERTQLAVPERHRLVGPERPVDSPVLASTAIPSSASERSRARMPSRSCSSTPLTGSSMTTRRGPQGERPGEHDAHGFRTVSYAGATAAQRSAPTRSSASRARERATVAETQLASRPTVA